MNPNLEREAVAAMTSLITNGAQFATHGLTSAEIKRLRIQFEGWPW